MNAKAGNKHKIAIRSKRKLVWRLGINLFDGKMNHSVKDSDYLITFLPFMM